MRRNDMCRAVGPRLDVRWVRNRIFECGPVIFLYLICYMFSFATVLSRGPSEGRGRAARPRCERVRDHSFTTAGYSPAAAGYLAT